MSSEEDPFTFPIDKWDVRQPAGELDAVRDVYAWSSSQ